MKHNLIPHFISSTLTLKNSALGVICNICGKSDKELYTEEVNKCLLVEKQNIDIENDSFHYNNISIYWRKLNDTMNEKVPCLTDDEYLVKKILE